MRVFACVLAAMAALQPQPTFRTGVELIRVDVTVLDKAGRPVTGLQAEDFEVTIDGAPRRVSFATFYGPTAGAPGAAPPSPAANAATNRNAAPGRVVVFVVDLESMTPGYEKVLLQTASTLVDRLGPRDAVGLLPIPGKGLDITRDRARVREALQALRGMPSATFQAHVISLREARAFELGDSRVIAEVVERECRASGDRGCPAELRNESRQVIVEAGRRIRTVLTTLSSLNARLQPIRAPKTVVVLSAGLPFDQENISYFSDLQKRAAESGTSTHVVQLAQPETDAGDRRMAGAGRLPASDLYEGLSTIAGVTGGSMSAGVGRAAGVFDRIAAEVTHSWQLGVEASDQDNDGKTHQIQVKLRREGLTVRARRELILPAARAKPSAIDLLGQPVDVLDVPVSVAGYTARGEEATTLKEILLIELPRGTATEPPPGYALTINKDDRVVFQTAGELRAAGAGGARAVTGAQLPPGMYRLRVAIVDAAGRPGTLEMPLGVGLRPMGALQVSDLFVGTTSDRFTPAIEAASGTPLTALLEVYAADPAAFDGASAALEVRRAGEDPIVASVPASVEATELPGKRIASGTIPATSLQAGSYTVSAIVLVNGRPIGKVSRPITVTP